jgi:c(7)-type cytochrome triheme protein
MAHQRAKNRALKTALHRRWMSLAILLAAATCFPLVLIINNARVSATAREPVHAQDVGRDYSRFLHTSPGHESRKCEACHVRRTNSSMPTFPGHKACTDCHLAQFVTPSLPMCAICHTNLEAQNPPFKAFPSSFTESFNMKFDHAQHNTGAARPQTGCAFCHTPTRRGVALSIPAHLPAHNQCYVCHTPGAKSAAGRDISSCATCHAQAPYARTSSNARAFRASFSHADHGPRQRLGCADCHYLTPGFPQSRQVSVPVTAQHFSSSRAQSCMTCHNGRRAFGETDFNDCKRCHQGQTFRMPV